MRNAASAVVCLLLAAGSSSAQTTAPWAQKLFSGVLSHDFGIVPPGAQLKHRFKMKNIYAVPLEITSIRNSCGCLTFTTSHPNQKPLQPQEEGWIDITMDARRFTGYKQINLFITVGPEYISTAVIEVTANARADVVFNPGNVDFGIVRQGQTPTRTTDLEHTRSQDWRILEVVPDAGAPFTVTLRELDRETGGGVSQRTGKVGYQLAVTLKSDAPPGPFRRDLLLKTNDPQSPVLTVVVEGYVQPPLTVTPSVVNLGTLKIGDNTSCRIAVRGSRPFRILAVAGGGTSLTVELPAVTAASHVLTLQYRPDQVGELRKHLIIRTDLDDGAIIAVTVEAKVQ